jgi:hypothetical protein
MEFLSSDRSTFSRQVRLAGSRQENRDELIVWAAILAILVSVCAFSWTFCLYVFGRPEKAFNYNLLRDLEKLAPLKDYHPANAPRGKFHTPRDLYQLYFNHTPRGLRALSAVLRRQYVTNYLGVESVTYVRGDFLIENLRVLGPGDVFPSGLVLRGRSEDYPNVVLEYVLPCAEVPAAHYDLAAHPLLEVATSSTCAAIIHVARIGDDRLCFTAVPLVYGDHETPAGTTLRLEPPPELNFYTPFPLVPDPAPGPPAPSSPPVP